MRYESHQPSSVLVTDAAGSLPSGVTEANSEGRERESTEGLLRLIVKGEREKALRDCSPISSLAFTLSLSLTLSSTPYLSLSHSLSLLTCS